MPNISRQWKKLDKETTKAELAQKFDTENFFNTEVQFANVKPAEQFWARDKLWVKTLPRVLEGGIFTNAININTPFVSDFTGTDRVLIHTIPEDE